MGGGRNRRVPVRWASAVTSAVGRAIGTIILLSCDNLKFSYLRTPGCVFRSPSSHKAVRIDATP